MKIKKPMTVKAPASEGAPAGGAIADRFKLEPIDNGAKSSGGTVGKKSAMAALVFGLVALAIAVTLTITIYKHWEYLMPA